MKTAQIQNMFFVLMMILICGGISWLATMELRKENEVRQKEIDHLKKSNKEEADRLRSELALTRDTLPLATSHNFSPYEPQTRGYRKERKEGYKPDNTESRCESLA